MHDDMPASFAASDLPSLFEFDAAAYDGRRSELANRYVDMLTAAGITPSVALLGLKRSEFAGRARGVAASSRTGHCVLRELLPA